MKKLIFILLCGLLILNLTGCGTKDDPSLGGQDSPTATVGLFTSYIEQGDYESAKTFFADESKTLYLVKMEEMYDLIKSGKVPATMLDDVKIVGDNAEVPKAFMDSNNENSYYMFYVNNTDDGWLIQSISEY